MSALPSEDQVQEVHLHGEAVWLDDGDPETAPSGDSLLLCGATVVSVGLHSPPF